MVGPTSKSTVSKNDINRTTRDPEESKKTKTKTESPPDGSGSLPDAPDNSDSTVEGQSDDMSTEKGIGVGAIAGIAVGSCIAVSAMLAIVAVCLIRKRCRRDSELAESPSDSLPLSAPTAPYSTIDPTQIYGSAPPIVGAGEYCSAPPEVNAPLYDAAPSNFGNDYDVAPSEVQS